MNPIAKIINLGPAVETVKRTATEAEVGRMAIEYSRNEREISERKEQNKLLWESIETLTYSEELAVEKHYRPDVDIIMLIGEGGEIIAERRPTEQDRAVIERARQAVLPVADAITLERPEELPPSKKVAEFSKPVKPGRFGG